MKQRVPLRFSLCGVNLIKSDSYLNLPILLSVPSVQASDFAEDDRLAQMSAALQPAFHN